MVSQRFLFLEPREKSHGQVGKATLPLCVMLRKVHAPPEKGKKHQFCLPSVGDSSARISKGGLEKSTFFLKFPKLFSANHSEHFPPLQGAQAKLRSPRLCEDLGRSPQITWEVATLENEFLGFLGVFWVFSLCDGTWNMPSLIFCWHLLEYLSCFDLFKTLQVHGNINIGISKCTAHT